MNSRKLGWPVYFPEVTNLANRLKLLQFGSIRRIGDSRDGCRWPLVPSGYEKWFRNSLTDKRIFGLLFEDLPRFTGD